MSDVFISYARSTAAQAQRIAELLRSLGFQVWRDDEIPAHRAFAEVIEERLNSAKAVVVLWSAEAVKSEWVQSEADRARNDRKLVQLRVEAVAPPMPFDRLQCADLADWKGDPAAPAWRKVVDSVAELVGAEPTPPSVDNERSLLKSAPRAGGRAVRRGLIAAGAVALVALAAGVLVWRPTSGRAAPWSDQDTRDTFAFAASPVTGDPALAAYAEQFTAALKSRFNPSTSDMRQAPDSATGTPPKAEFMVGLEFARANTDITTRVTLQRGAAGSPIDASEVADSAGASPSLPAVLHASEFVKRRALDVEAAETQAKPASQRDAHDLVILAMNAPGDRAHNAEAGGWLDKAERMNPDQRLIRDALVSNLDTRLNQGWSNDSKADLARLDALDERLLSENANDAYALMSLSDYYLLEGRPDDARIAAERALHASPYNAGALVGKGRADLALGHFPEADEMVAKLLPMQNTALGASIDMLAGLVRFHQGRFGEAADFLRRAVQEIAPDDMKSPAFAGLRLYLAAAEVEQGDKAAAQSVLADFRAAVPQARGPAAFGRWNDPLRLPLVDRTRLESDLARLGWKDA